MAKTQQKKAVAAKKPVAKKAIKKVSSKKSSSARASSKKQEKYGAPIKKVITMYKTPSDYFQMNRKYQGMGIGTRLIHAGNEPSSEFHGVNPAIDLSTTYAQPAPGEPVVFDYARCGNPTRQCLERQIAAMEHANYAFATSSGMAAHVTIINLLKDGDHILCIDDVYGGTQRYLRKILSANTKITVDFSSFHDAKAFKKMLKPETKVVWLETPTNPTLKCFDIKKIAEAMKGHNAIFCVDNTFATPINTNPLLLGADIVTHSMTKYIGGHSDVIAGCMALNSKKLYDDLFFVLKTMGTGLSAFDSYLAIRGAKTLEVRQQKAQSNAMAVAKFLESHKKVVKVLYPGLKSHPDHAIHMRQSRGGGAMISFYIKGGMKQARAFLCALKVFTLAESLGGVESLIECPVIMTHGSVPPEQRKILGIEDNFIRISVGIENEADLLADMKQAFAKV